MPSLEQVREWIAAEKSIVAFTGAGISAESGVPTFRGPGGLWRNYRPEDLATPEAFRRNPALVWEWYDWRRQSIAKALPNPAHFALAAFEATHRQFTLVTQNVDGLHDLAGSRKILKLHGDIWLMRCMECAACWNNRETPLFEIPPRCRCGGLARPGVVWFGEQLPEGAMEKAQHAAARAGVFLVIGTSAVVYPAAGLIAHAKANGAKVVEINTERTPFSDLADCVVQEPAGEALPKLL